ncbi:hypothetical protein SAMN05216196_10983 [Lutimaribacter pacificus]|uniref:Uncharacterized protein n=1 Tax=Lutimaribacter pacificus TaxID=391948 RepID=A0A1H0M7X8_9RHOB|nr:hypothetical protein [Lutimaribacter pacificus]SDO76391.1 hypothetical protein SAMN05216196_10983 [Lutimaribacter pacificus]SHK78708.1 hypothetical protein SAMN05444142_10983 [Lutimaribacter pacificus]
MADRKRSQDRSKDTDRLFGPEGPVGHQGRTGGELQRKKASKDELKRATERPAGATRVRKSDEKDD